MATRDEYLSIIRRYGFEGEVSELLADLFQYYSTNYLQKTLAQYYNLSLLRAPSIDAALQLAMDLGYPAFRGIMPTAIAAIRFERPTQLFPLEVLHSAGGAAVVWTGRKPRIYAQTPPNSSTTLAMRLSPNLPTTRPIPEGVIEHYIIDDIVPISEDVAIYTQDNNGTREYWNITRYPWLFFAERAHANPTSPYEYPVLVMTTQRYGLYLRFKRPTPPNLYITYLPFDTVKQINYENLLRTFQHPNIQMLGNPPIQIRPYRMPDTREMIAYNAAESSRFSGVIRSNSDIASILRELYHDEIIDARTTVSPTTNNYIIKIIPFTQSWAISNANNIVQSLSNYISNALPLSTTTTAINIVELTGVSITFEAQVIGSNPQAISQSMADYLSEYMYRFLEAIDFRVWLTKLASNSNVDAILSIQIKKNNTVIYSFPGTSTSTYDFTSNNEFIRELSINIDTQ